MWQFLYSLLTSTESKHREIIEWTSNIHEREFRMLEPESIAVWWGHHKNKPNMSYDKFSRSLRYYYDKGILKKIPGERYVYRFLIDPEHMYHHIGTSDCRPKLKPMPQAAKVAMSKYQHNSGIDFKTNWHITQDPEPLEKKFKSESSSVKSAERTESTEMGGLFPIIPDHECSNGTVAINSTVQNSSSTGNLLELCHEESTGSLSMKRCRSLEYTSSNCRDRIPKQIALPMDSASCQTTLSNSYEAFPTNLTSYSHVQNSASHDACIGFATSESSTSDPHYAMSQSNNVMQLSMPQKLYYNHFKSNADYTY